MPRVCQSLSRVQLFVTPWIVAHQAPVHGILQARVLEWVAISFSRGSSRPRDQTQVSWIAGKYFTVWATRKALAASKLTLPPPLGSNQASTDPMMPTYTGVSDLHYLVYGFKCSSLCGASGKEPACQRRRHKRHGFNPWVRKIPWRSTWQPIPVFLPGKSHGQRSLVSYVHRVAKSQTGLKRQHACTHAFFQKHPRNNVLPASK